jgi:hypothetical protein
MRTAKSCGPDASTLASSLRIHSQATVTKKPDRRGEREISRKTIARGMPDVSRCDLTNACAFYHYHCTRGYRAHRTPGIPCALDTERAERADKNSRETSGEIAKLCTVISPPSTRPCAWRGPRRAKLALEVGGGWSISLLLWRRVCRGTPHPNPSPALRGGRGGVVRDGRLFETESVAHLSLSSPRRRMIQYSRDVSDRTETPRRTG